MPDQWIPHKPETWPWRIAKLKADVEFRTWHGHGAEPEFTHRTVPAGTTVKIVMVSRLGDVGITDYLAAENGYAARVMLDTLEPVEPAPADVHAERQRAYAAARKQHTYANGRAGQ